MTNKKKKQNRRAALWDHCWREADKIRHAIFGPTEVGKEIDDAILRTRDAIFTELCGYEGLNDE